MKYLLISILLITQIVSQVSALALENINSFEADFVQSITDDKDTVLTYNGHVVASKPQNAKWNYTKPINKDVYMNQYDVVIVEPDIEQVIIRRVQSKFDFFNMIKNAKKIKENTYLASFEDSKFTVVKSGDLIESISYIDEFENRVKIIFTNQQQNHKISAEVFTPKYPLYFDIIRD